VNERFMVHGTYNLRITDASIMALILRGNIQASVYSVVERAVDLVKEDHNMRI
jgi:choline dehydrogenase-like flavoprotein